MGFMEIIGWIVTVWLGLGALGWLMHVVWDGWGKGLRRGTDEWVLLAVSAGLGPLAVLAMIEQMRRERK